jgi:hypothetical protein
MLRLWVLFFIAPLVMPALLWADGFVCNSPKGFLRIKIFHHTRWETGGTRRAAVMVLSNPRMPRNKKTIAVFQEANGTLSNSGMEYLARFDLRFSLIKSKPHHFINQIDRADVHSLLIRPNGGLGLAHGTPLTAYMEMTMRDGRVYKGNIRCKRYLKSRQRRAANAAAACQTRVAKP